MDPLTATAPVLTIQTVVSVGQTGAWVGPLLVGLAAAALDYSAVGPHAMRDRVAVAGYYASAISFVYLLGLAGWEKTTFADYNWRMIGACASLATHGALLLAMFGTLIGPTRTLAKSMQAKVKFATEASGMTKVNQPLLELDRRGRRHRSAVRGRRMGRHRREHRLRHDGHLGRRRLPPHEVAGGLTMDTLMNWLAFALLIYFLGVGAHRWPGPVSIYRIWRARRALATDAEEEYFDDDVLDDDVAPRDGSGVTRGDGHRGDIDPDTAQDTDIEAETSQDTYRDTGHPNPSRRLWTRVRQAVDLAWRGEQDIPTCPSPVSSAPSPRPPSPTVTGRGSRGTSPTDADAPEQLPRVVVHYVEPGSWTGQVSGTGDDGHPVVIRYVTRSAIAAPTAPLTRPSVEPKVDEQAPSDAMAIDEITVRREWLRTMSASGNFTAEEIRDLYLAKWGKTPKTLSRDLAAIADAGDSGRQNSG